MKRVNTKISQLIAPVTEELTKRYQFMALISAERCSSVTVWTLWVCIASLSLAANKCLHCTTSQLQGWHRWYQYSKHRSCFSIPHSTLTPAGISEWCPHSRLVLHSHLVAKTQGWIIIKQFKTIWSDQGTPTFRQTDNLPNYHSRTVLCRALCGIYIYIYITFLLTELEISSAQHLSSHCYYEYFYFYHICEHSYLPWRCVHPETL